jgi:hypothetical protein
MKSGSLLKKAMALKELLCNNDHLFTAQWCDDLIPETGLLTALRYEL